MVTLGKYKLKSSENFDEYLKAIGVNSMDRKLMMDEKPTVEIKYDGDKYIVTTSTATKSIQIKFNLGTEFEEMTWEGRNCKSIITQDDNKLVQTQMCNDKISNVVRDFGGGKMTVTLSAGGVVATRVFKQVTKEAG